MVKSKVKSRATYFSPTELENLITVYAEYENAIQKKKSNKTAAPKQCEPARKKTGEHINAGSDKETVVWRTSQFACNWATGV